jgi:hypothetical protein
MKQAKLIGIAFAAFALASVAMAAAPRLVEQGISRIQKHQSASAPDVTQQQSALETVAVATAQEATSLTQ